MDKNILVSAEVGLTPLAIEQKMAYYPQQEITAIYVAEYDLPLYRRACEPKVFGMLVGYPFGGVSEVMVLSYLERMVELECQRLVLTLGTNDLASSDVDSFRRKVSVIAVKAKKLDVEVVWEIPAVLLTDAQVDLALQVFAEVKATRLSFSTNSELDVLDINRLLSFDRMISAMGQSFVLEIGKGFPKEELEKLASPFTLREYI